MLAAVPMLKWEDAQGVHFTDDRRLIPAGARVEVVTSTPVERNGLMPPPEPVRGPFKESEWRKRFADLRERRQQVMSGRGLVSRQCHDRAVELSVTPVVPAQMLVTVHDCLPGQVCAARTVTVTLPPQPPQTVRTMVQDCTETVVASAQAELTRALVDLRADDAALTAEADQHQVPQAWREP